VLQQPAGDLPQGRQLPDADREETALAPGLARSGPVGCPAPLECEDEVHLFLPQPGRKAQKPFAGPRGEPYNPTPHEQD
jgi:hypothetical protein